MLSREGFWDSNVQENGSWMGDFNLRREKDDLEEMIEQCDYRPEGGSLRDLTYWTEEVL